MNALNENVSIQLMDKSGNWRTFATVANFPIRITQEMKNLQNRFPTQRVRAVDKDGKLVDIL